ncbi:MAG: anti-sigma factor family protein [Bacillota bacterium]
MRCHEVQEMLSAYFDGMLDPSAKNAVDLHLEGCAACRIELEDLSFVVGLVRELPLVDPPAEFGESLRSRVEALRPVKTRGFLQKIALGRWSRVVAVAASFLLVIGIAGAWPGFSPLSMIKEDSQLGSYNASKDSSPADNLIAGDKITWEDLKNSEKTLSSADSAEADIVQKESAANESAGSADTTGTARNSAPMAVTIKQPEDLSVAALPPRESVQDAGSVSARGFAPGIMSAPSLQESAPEKSFIEIKVGDSSAAVKKISDIARMYRGSAEVLPETAGKELTVIVPDSQFEIVMAEIRKTGQIVTEGSPQLKKAAAPQGAGEITVTSTSLADGKEVAGEDNNSGQNPFALKAEQQPKAYDAGNNTESKEKMAVIRVILSD